MSKPDKSLVFTLNFPTPRVKSGDLAPARLAAAMVEPLKDGVDNGCMTSPPASAALAFESLALSPATVANLQQLGYLQMTPIQAASLPRAGQVGRHVTLWQPAHGGHVGFPAGPFPGHVLHMPAAVADWLATRA